jgi:hypothetical protein
MKTSTVFISPVLSHRMTNNGTVRKSLKIWAHFLLRKKPGFPGVPPQRTAYGPAPLQKQIRRICDLLRTSSHPYGVSVFITVHRLRGIAAALPPGVGVCMMPLITRINTNFTYHDLCNQCRHLEQSV